MLAIYHWGSQINSIIFPPFSRDDGSTVPVRIYTPKDKLQLAVHALHVQMHVLKVYEDLYDIRYQLPKLDCIAIPDFVTGAMEQWGLITYRIGLK